MLNIKKVKLLSIALISATLLCGCEGLWQNKMQAGKVSEEIQSNNDFYPEDPAAVYIDRPGIEQMQYVPVKINPPWAESPVKTMHFDGAPIHAAMRQILSGKGVNYYFGQESSANTPINGTISGSVKESFDTISAITGLSYEIKADGVSWTQYVTESFSIGYIPGKNDYKIGSTPREGSESGSGSGSAEQISFGTDTKQFTSISAEGQDAFSEMETIIAGIVENWGSITVSRSTNSVIVTTTKSRMERVKTYMNEVERSLGRQIAFEIQFFRFTSNKSGSAGIDWDLVREKSKGVLNFDGGDLASISPGSTPITFSATKTTGSEAGSKVLLGILQENGTVSVVNKPRIVTQINRVAELELSQLTGYIAKTEVTQNGSIGTSGPTVTLTPGVVESGYTLYTIANIAGSDKIVLHMASTYTDLIGITRKEVLDSAIESPEMSRNKMVSTTVLRNGQTMIIGGLNMNSTNEKNSSPISPTALPTRNIHSGTNTETIALVTPIIVDMN